MAQARTETEAHERGHHSVSARFWAGAASAYESWHEYDPEGRLDMAQVTTTLTDPLWAQLETLQKKWDGNDKLTVPCEFAQPSS